MYQYRKDLKGSIFFGEKGKRFVLDDEDLIIINGTKRKVFSMATQSDLKYLHDTKTKDLKGKLIVSYDADSERLSTMRGAVKSKKSRSQSKTKNAGNSRRKSDTSTDQG